MYLYCATWIGGPPLSVSSLTKRRFSDACGTDQTALLKLSLRYRGILLQLEGNRVVKLPDWAIVGPEVVLIRNSKTDFREGTERELEGLSDWKPEELSIIPSATRLGSTSAIGFIIGSDLVNKLVPWCACLLSGALEILQTVWHFFTLLTSASSWLGALGNILRLHGLSVKLVILHGQAWSPTGFIPSEFWA